MKWFTEIEVKIHQTRYGVNEIVDDFSKNSHLFGFTKKRMFRPEWVKTMNLGDAIEDSVERT